MRERLRRRLGRNVQLGLVYALALILFLVASVAVNGFSSGRSLNNILLAATILALAAAGQTLVIFAAGVDLSVPWTMAGAALLTSSLSGGHDDNLVWVIPLVLGFAALVGLINGLGITALGVSPIVMTLATNVMLNGFIALEVPSGAHSSAPPGIGQLAFGSVIGIPAPLIVLVVTTLAMTLLLTFTPYGPRLYAVGTSVAASRFAGVRVGGVLVVSYVLCSLLAAVGGLLLLGFTGEAFNGMGDQYQFASIAAVIVGGASILGGRGHYVGTVGGVLLLTVLTTLLQVFSLGAGALKIFYGLVILLSVWLIQADLPALLRRGQRTEASAGGP